jgi:hypothetical protein
MRGLMGRLARLVSNWLDDLSGLRGLLEGIWELGGVFLSSFWGPVSLVLLVAGLLAVTPRLRRWLKESLEEEAEESRPALTPIAPLPDPISPQRSRVWGRWLGVSATVAVGTFGVIFDRDDSLAALLAFSLALGGITLLGFLVNFMLFGGAWRLTFDEEGIHATSGLTRRFLGWEDIRSVWARGRRLRIFTTRRASDLICWGLPKGVAQKSSDQLQQCLGKLQVIDEASPADT